MKEAIASLPFHTEITGNEKFQTDGELRENDWSEGDAAYRSRISAFDSNNGGTGQSDILGWVENELRPKVEAVNVREEYVAHGQRVGGDELAETVKRRIDERIEGFQALDRQRKWSQ